MTEETHEIQLDKDSHEHDHDDFVVEEVDTTLETMQGTYALHHEVVQENTNLPDVTSVEELQKILDEKKNIPYVLLMYDDTKTDHVLVEQSLAIVQAHKAFAGMKFLKVSAAVLKQKAGGSLENTLFPALLLVKNGEIVWEESDLDPKDYEGVINQRFTTERASSPFVARDTADKQALASGNIEEKHQESSPSPFVAYDPEKGKKTVPFEKKRPKNSPFVPFEKETPKKTSTANDTPFAPRTETIPDIATEEPLVSEPNDLLQQKEMNPTGTVILEKKVSVSGGPYSFTASFATSNQNILEFRDNLGRTTGLGIRNRFPQMYTAGGTATAEVRLHDAYYTMKLANNNGRVSVQLAFIKQKITSTPIPESRVEKKEGIISLSEKNLIWYDKKRIRGYDTTVYPAPSNPAAANAFPKGLELERTEEGRVFAIQKDRTYLRFRDKDVLLVNLSVFSDGARTSRKVGAYTLRIKFELDKQGILRCFLDPSPELIAYRKNPKENEESQEEPEEEEQENKKNSPEPDPKPVPTPEVNDYTIINLPGNFPTFKGKQVTSYFEVIQGVPQSHYGKVKIYHRYNRSKREYRFYIFDSGKSWPMRGVDNEGFTLDEIEQGNKILTGTLSGNKKHTAPLSAYLDASNAVRFVRGNEVHNTYENHNEYGGMPPDLLSPVVGTPAITDHMNFANPDGTHVLSRKLKSITSQRRHEGIDIDGAIGDNIKAAADGVVVYVKDDEKDNLYASDFTKRGNTYVSKGSGYGNTVMIKHDNGTYTMYGHLRQSSALVKVGDKVRAGAIIAKMGNSGHVFTSDISSNQTKASHLHFEYFRMKTTFTTLTEYYTKGRRIRRGYGFQRLDPEEFLPGGSRQTRVIRNKSAVPTQPRNTTPVAPPPVPEKKEPAPKSTGRVEKLSNEGLDQAEKIVTTGWGYQKTATGYTIYTNTQQGMQQYDKIGLNNTDRKEGYYTKVIYGMSVTFDVIGDNQLVIRNVMLNNGMRGVASYYSSGRQTASGEKYNANALTAAHRWLPFGTMVKVINLTNNKSVIVRINDRGPFTATSSSQRSDIPKSIEPYRLIDLSRRAAEQIDMIGSGVAQVKVEIYRAPSENPT